MKRLPKKPQNRLMLNRHNRRLAVMDSTAITFCMDNQLPIIVFDVTEPGNIARALMGEPIGTVVSTA